MKTIANYIMKCDPSLIKRPGNIAMPGGAEIIRVDDFFGKARLWAIIDNQMAIITRTFINLMIDEQIPPGAQYIGTWAQSTYWIWHLFEVKK